MTDNKTPFKIRCEILEELWTKWGEIDDFQDFFSYNDLALPFAYGVVNNLIEPNEKVEQLIDETFGLLLDGLELEDTGFSELDEVLQKATDKGTLNLYS